ncbi:GNAT family N-acetyltransferase, partial [Micrococcus sp. KRD012]|uniref:GNAT family N-acetyltransferase n=1 Tax=Micrococcus sp. KRD012 TaxID=2729716 RepID=UPI0019D0E843
MVGSVGHRIVVRDHAQAVPGALGGLGAHHQVLRVRLRHHDDVSAVAVRPPQGLVGGEAVRPEDAHRGRAGVRVVAQQHQAQAEIGWTIAQAHAGRGRATELACALLDLAFAGLGVRPVEAH